VQLFLLYTCIYILYKLYNNIGDFLWQVVWTMCRSIFILAIVVLTGVLLNQCEARACSIIRWHKCHNKQQKATAEEAAAREAHNNESKQMKNVSRFECVWINFHCACFLLGFTLGSRRDLNEGNYMIVYFCLWK